MQVLVHLADRGGSVVGRDEILKTVWKDSFVSDEVLTNAIRELRRALGDDPNDPDFIQTVPKKGYRLIAPVVRDSESSLGETVRELVVRARPVWIGASLIVFGFIVGKGSRLDEEPATIEPVRFTIEGPGGAVIPYPGEVDYGIALSRDGRELVFTARHEGGSRLYRRSLQQEAVEGIPGSEDASIPFFSPDGSWIGFHSRGELKKIATAGGEILTLCRAEGVHGATWTTADRIVYAPRKFSGLYEVPAGGGESKPLTQVNRQSDEIAHRSPFGLPETGAVLFTVLRTGGDRTDLAVIVPDAEQHEILLEDARHPRYAFGHVFFLRNSGLWAVPFDTHTERPSGDSVLIVPWRVSPFGRLPFDVSESGTLVHAATDGARRRRLVWVDRRGTATPLSDHLRAYEDPRISPNGRAIAVTIREDDTDLWLLDVPRETLRRLTSHEASDDTPVWGANSDRLFYRSDRTGAFKLYELQLDTTELATQLTEGPHFESPSAVAPDEHLVYAKRLPETGWDLWRLALDGTSPPAPILTAPFAEYPGTVSPDGRFIAYVSNETGRREVYVTSYPEAVGKWLISNDGGVQPMWSPSGDELFFWSGDRFMRVAVALSPAFQPSKPEVLFVGSFSSEGWSGYANFDVSADGSRFLMVQSEDGSPETKIHVVLNWHDELGKKKADR